MNNTFEQLYELHEALSDNDMWIAALDNTLDYFGVKNLDELIKLALDEDDESMVHDLINEGDYILSLQQEDTYEWYNDDEIFDDY